MNPRSSWLRGRARLLSGPATGFLIAFASLLPVLPAQASTTTVGTLAGSFGVTPTGAATYAIPIRVPRGSGGLTPSIALVYNSQSGSGAAGWGWTLAGLSAITRCNKTIDDDGVAQAVQLTSSDDYCLDGQRLRSIGTDTYDTELRAYDQITATSGTNGPDHFEVQTKNGMTYEYGNTTDSRILATGTSTARVWALDRVTDANGNYYTITYQNNDTITGDYWPVDIQYTGNTQAGNSLLHDIHFTWGTRADAAIRSGFVYGTLITQTQVLTGISVEYNGSATFTYTLSYNATPPAVPADNRYQLSGVQECDANSECFPATTIVWQEGAAGWQGDVAISGATVADAAHAAAAHLMDVNGDGIQDLVYPGPNGDWMVMFGQAGGGLGLPVDTQVAYPTGSTNYYQYALGTDINGDGLQDLMVPEADGYWHALEGTGNETAGQIFNDVTTNLSDTGVNSQTGEPIYEGEAAFTDYYGHGLGDFVYSDGTNIYLDANNGPTGNPQFGNPQIIGSVAPSSNLSTPTPTVSQYQFIDMPLDFDGSGRMGRLGLQIKAIRGATSYIWNALAPSPSGYQLVGALRSSSPSGIGATQPVPIDANGDGITDLVWINPATDDAALYLGEGQGFASELDLGVALYGNTSDPVFADYYGDGRQELIVYEPTGLNPGWKLIGVNYDLTSNSFARQTTALTASTFSYPSGEVAGSLRVGNIGANGLNDLVYAVDDSGTYTWHYELHQGGAADLVTQVTDGLGNVFEPTYASLAGGSGVYTKGSGAVWPVQDVQFPMQVVSSYQASDGIGGLYKETFTYAGGESETEGRGFLGFASRTVTDSRNGVAVTDSYNQSYPFIGSLAGETVTQSNGKTLNTIGNTYVSAPSSCNGGVLCFPYLSVSTVTVNDATSGSSIKSVATHNTFGDGYGDLTDRTVTTTDLTTSPNQTFTTETQTVYADSAGSTYCISIPEKVTVTKTSPTGSMVRESDSSNNFDTIHCRPNQTVVEAGVDNATNVNGAASHPLTTAFQYDSYGNVSQTTVSGADMPNHITHIGSANDGEYPGSVGRVVNANLSVTTSATWNSALGVETSVTDPNGHITTITPDGFGRTLSETAPDGVTASWSYDACASNCVTNGVYYVSRSVTNNGGTQTLPVGTSEYDAKGRAVAVGTVLLGGGTSWVQTTYDALGRATAVSKPFFSSPQYWTDTSYDVLNRPVQITAPANAGNGSGDVTTIRYPGFTTAATEIAPTTSDFANETTNTVTDALGEITSKTDGSEGANTTYIYDPFGDLISTTDADQHTTSMTYDGLAHKIAMTDPNMGSWNYPIVDALGEVLTQTDADNNTITQTYDPLGRLTGRTEKNSSGTVTANATWGWDTAANGIGQLASESDSVSGFQKAYTYDSLSRLADVGTTIGATDYHVSPNYDSFGRVATLTYPISYGSQRFELQYLYDPASGALATVEDAASGVVYWQAASGSSAVDAFGHLLGWTDGNNVSTVMTYDVATGVPLHIQSGPNGSSAVQYLTYTWGGYGNLEERQDNNQNLTETLQYDDLNRLHQSTVTNPGGNGPGSQYNYDATGNITTRTIAGTSETYNYDPNHPYAVDTVTSGGSTLYSASYDADGNMTSRNGYPITWTPGNLPASIASASGSSTFSYDPDHQRYYQAATFNGVTTDTTYVGGLFEVVSTSSSTEYRHNIMADGQVVAVHTITQSGSASTDYLHYDHLGSVDAITDNSGSVIQAMSFDAFGLRRDAANWDYDLSQNTIATLKNYTDRGYTDQEELDNLSLVDLNGRVYDPTVGRMISADPTVPAPFYSQAFNRFTYVYDNPLVNVDPTGLGSDPCQGKIVEAINVGGGSTRSQGDACPLGPVTVTGTPVPPPSLNSTNTTPQPGNGPQPGTDNGPNPGKNPKDNSKPPQPKPEQQPKQPPCTASRQAAAQLSSGFAHASEITGGLATASTIGTALSGAGEGVTFGGDTPVTVSFGSMSIFFWSASAGSGAAAAALNSYAAGNTGALQNFGWSQLAGIASAAASSKLPGVAQWADTIGHLSEQAANLVASNEEACR